MTYDLGPGYQTYEFTQNKAPDVVFEGRLLASIDSRDHVAENDRNRDRWTELAVYQTRSGNWVAVEHGRSAREGETDRTDVTFIPRDHQFPMRRAAVAAFGYGWLAKRMAELEGWDVREKYA